MRAITLIPFAVVTAAGGAALTAMFQHPRQVRPLPAIEIIPTNAVTGGIRWNVPEFSLTDQDNKPFSLHALRGKVWVADFVFTGCANACPLLSRQMAQVQGQVGESPVHFVSFDVDPDHDTPTKLKEYGNIYHADFSRWHFLSFPSRAAAFDVARGMKVTQQQDDRDFQLLHSDHFFLVDGDFHVRGIYDATQDASLHQLAKDAMRLIEATRPNANH